MQHEKQSVVRAPNDEDPVRAVPQSTQQHRDHEVSVRHETRASIATERDVDVVAKKRRERDVPAPPEIREVRRLVRRVEVLGQAQPEQIAEADRHVAVARKVEIQLIRIAQHAQPRAQRRQLRVSRQRRIDHGGDGIGDEDLLDHADHEE